MERPINHGRDQIIAKSGIKDVPVKEERIVKQKVHLLFSQRKPLKKLVLEGGSPADKFCSLIGATYRIIHTCNTLHVLRCTVLEYLKKFATTLYIDLNIYIPLQTYKQRHIPRSGNKRYTVFGKRLDIGRFPQAAASLNKPLS